MFPPSLATFNHETRPLNEPDDEQRIPNSFPVSTLYVESTELNTYTLELASNGSAATGGAMAIEYKYQHLKDKLAALSELTGTSCQTWIGLKTRRTL